MTQPFVVDPIKIYDGKFIEFSQIYTYRWFLDQVPIYLYERVCSYLSTYASMQFSMLVAPKSCFLYCLLRFELGLYPMMHQLIQLHVLGDPSSNESSSLSSSSIHLQLLLLLHWYGYLGLDSQKHLPRALRHDLFRSN